jgi:hypothetical protein
MGSLDQELADVTAGRVDAVIATVERHDAWRPVAEAAGVLLTLLGLDRYAAIARASTTTAVLDA